MQKSADDILDFTVLFNRYKTKIYNYVLKMTNDRMTTEDIIQNVFLKLYENIDSIRKKGSINYWIFTAARNEVYMFFRSKKIRTDQFNVEDTDELEIPSDFDLDSYIEIKETKDLIKQELANISSDQREVFILKEYGMLSYGEIASVMKIDENLVKSRLFKTRQRLINKLSKTYKNL